MGTTYLQIGTWSPLSFWLGLACGAYATAILATNNIRDVSQDGRAGKKTLIVRLGVTFGKLYYLGCLLTVPCISFFILHNELLGVIIITITAILYYKFLKAKGREYNRILMMTGFADLIFA